MSPVITVALESGDVSPPIFVRSIVYACLSFPICTRSFDGVMLGASTTSCADPPRSSSPWVSSEMACQKLVDPAVKVGPAANRITESPPFQSVPDGLVTGVLLLAMKMLVPSLEGPPGAHIPASLAGGT